MDLFRVQSQDLTKACGFSPANLCGVGPHLHPQSLLFIPFWPSYLCTSHPASIMHLHQSSRNEVSHSHFGFSVQLMPTILWNVCLFSSITEACSMVTYVRSSFHLLPLLSFIDALIESAWIDCRLLNRASYCSSMLFLMKVFSHE